MLSWPARRASFGVLALLLACAGAAPRTARAPSVAWGALYADIAMARVFEDSKTLADAIPRGGREQVLARYQSERAQPEFDLRRFVHDNFVLPSSAAPPPAPQQVRVQDHIDALWTQLTRGPDVAQPHSSLIALPHRYVVPGGRFREIYYWDSYFTMLGLEASGRGDLSDEMLQNFAWLIRTFGHVPNGNRSYYLSRSQPPFYAQMVALVAQRRGPAVLVEHLATLRREYAYWMQGRDEAARTGAAQRVVRMPDGALLNRYWDALDTPRDEAYREDVETAKSSGRAPSDVYRDLRAAAESGWDFSSRWLSEEAALSSIHTTHVIPPDLNALLYALERTIADACTRVQDSDCVATMDAAARARLRAIETYLWSPTLGAYVDYDFVRGAQATRLTAATYAMLYVGGCGEERARTVADTGRAALLHEHGLATTTVVSGQQWDAPNGWAPLNWIAIAGLRRYGLNEHAAAIAERWIAGNLALYEREGKLSEKYDVSAAERGTGGEYPAQDGFGWTNGVLRQLLRMYPEYDRQTH